MAPLTAALLAGRARLAPRALVPLQMAASARGGEVIWRGARSAATDAGPPRRGEPTSEDEEHTWDSYGAMPASPGGQPQPPSKEALRQHDVKQAETQPPLESDRTEPGVRCRDADALAVAPARNSLGSERCDGAMPLDDGAPWRLTLRLAQVHVHAGSPLPGGVEGVEVTNALPGRPRGAGAPFEQRRGP